METAKLGMVFSGARVFSNSSVPIPSGADTAVPFDSERYDTDGYRSVTTNPTQFTIPVSGKYHIGAIMTMDANLTGRRYATLRLNNNYKIGNTGLSLNTDGGGVPHRPVGGPSMDWDFVAGDFVELVVFQDSGVSLNLSVFTDQATEMWIHRLGV